MVFEKNGVVTFYWKCSNKHQSLARVEGRQGYQTDQPQLEFSSWTGLSRILKAIKAYQVQLQFCYVHKYDNNHL